MLTFFWNSILNYTSIIRLLRTVTVGAVHLCVPHRVNLSKDSTYNCSKKMAMKKPSDKPTALLYLLPHYFKFHSQFF